SHRFAEMCRDIEPEFLKHECDKVDRAVADTVDLEHDRAAELLSDLPAEEALGLHYPALRVLQEKLERPSSYQRRPIQRDRDCRRSDFVAPIVWNQSQRAAFTVR